ncbi:MAG: phage tail tube protein [Bacteroidaceae bacterium]|nr:phage tail tube protein [Bacteroidaceae bacterium]
MAVLGNNVFITVGEGGGARIIAGTRTNEIKTAAETIPISSIFGGRWKENMAGRCSWSISTGFLVLATEDVKQLLKVGQHVKISVMSREKETLRAHLIGDAIITEANMSFATSKLAQGNFSFLGNGPLQDPSNPETPNIPNAPILPSQPNYGYASYHGIGTFYDLNTTEEEPDNEQLNTTEL